MKNISNRKRLEQLYEQVETEVYISDYKAKQHEKTLIKDPSFCKLKEELIAKRGESYFNALMLKESSIDDLKRAVRDTKLKEYMTIESKMYPDYFIEVPQGKILLFHNTTEENAESIALEGLKASAGAKQGRGLDGDFVWGTTTRNLKGYGGYTVAFVVDEDKAKPYKVNDTEYTLPFDIPSDDILFIDEPIGVSNYRESDIKKLVDLYGEDRVAEVLSKKSNMDSDAIGLMISKALNEAEEVTREILHKNPIELSVYYKDGYGNDMHSTHDFANVRALFKYIRECGGFKSMFDKDMKYFIKSSYGGGEYYLVRDRFAKEGWKWQDCNGRDLPGQFKTFKHSDLDLSEKVTTYVVDFNKLLEIDPELEYELESRSGNEDYKKIYKKFTKSASNRIRLTVYEMDLIAYIYEDTDKIDNICDILYKGLARAQSKLTEANLLDLIDDSKANDPKRIKLASTIYTSYKGVDSDGTLLFESDSQTRSGLTHRQRVFYPGFFDLLDTVDAGDEITEEQMVDIITNDLMVDCSCESFLYYAWAYKSWKEDYGLMKELRKPERNNIDLKGGACKHVLSVLDLLNRSNTVFEQVTRDLNVLFQKYKKRTADQAQPSEQTEEQPEDNAGE